MVTLVEFREWLVSELEMLKGYNRRLEELMDTIIKLEDAGSIDISADEKKDILDNNMVLGVIYPILDRIKSKITQIT